MKTTILTFLSLCLILVIGCGENSTTFRGKSSLGKEEIRGKILSIDKNNSLIRAEILGCGESLFKDWGEFSGFVKSFTVQPGDLNLLSKSILYSGIINFSLDKILTSIGYFFFSISMFLNFYFI